MTLSNAPETGVPPVEGGIRVRRSCTVQHTPQILYGFWRQFSNLPRIMSHVLSVTETSATESHWVVTGPANRTVEWDAVVTEEIPDRLIAWRTNGNPWVDHAGSVQFNPAPGGRGTEVRVSLEYHPPGGKLGDLGLKLLAKDPGEQIAQDLHRFKALLETGEIPTTQGQPVGAGKETHS